MSGRPVPSQRSAVRKVYRAGTHRVRHPARTWEVIAPKLSRFGITRVADVTGLDTLGVPVVMSVRPAASVLAVSQGKGQSVELARISAAMEAIELWHAERVRPPLVHRARPARDLRLPYAVGSLTDAGSLIGEATPLDWIEAAGLVSGRRIPVPADAVVFRHTADGPWRPAGLTWTSNGLAAGNSWEEACLHALYEIVERDTVCAPGRPDPVPVDPRTVEDPGCAGLISGVVAAGADLEIGWLPNELDVPVFQARLWSADFPVAAVGWGAHSDAGVALSRALTEAAQSRLTAIVGTREDLPQVYDVVGSGLVRGPQFAACPRPWREAVAGPAHAFEDTATELSWLCAGVERAVGHEPLAVDLGTDPDFAVVRLVVPGARIDLDVIHPRR